MSSRSCYVRHRNARSHKTYVSLFVCFATKAIRLDLVSDLTSEVFIAFKRFISRSDRPALMYSDNGTTFAHRQIQEYDMYNDQQVQSEIKDFLHELDISWSFMSPNAPYFESLWEAANRKICQIPHGSWARLIWSLRKFKRPSVK